LPTYAIYGGLLDSEVSIAGLDATAGEATWRFRVKPGPVAALDRRLIGSEQVSEELTTSLWRTAAGGWELHYSAFDLGEFTISPDGRDIVWSPGPDPWLDALRWVLLGRVMATAMYAAGRVCLHASAVAIDGAGMCFLARSRYGKSTLAAAMVAAGARLVTDDVLPVDTGPAITIRPGLPLLRLAPDVEQSLAFSRRVGASATYDTGKLRIDLPPSVRVHEPCPLSVVYLLDPVPAETEGILPSERIPCGGVTALEDVIQKGSLASLISPTESALLFGCATTIVNSVPIYRLRVTRDLRRLMSVADLLCSWHSEVCTAQAS
jgi:hypothetical protein